MKNCIKCGELKPRSEFYPHKAMADGTLNKCKNCCRSDAIANRAKRVDYYRAYDLARFATPSRKATRDRMLRQHRDKFPEKNAARAAVARALRSGVLVRGDCEVCGYPQVDAHHDDYSKPLSVRWLCRTHHIELHVAARSSASMNAS